MAEYIIPALRGKGLTANGNADGGIDVKDALGQHAVTLRASYVNECGGAVAALDEFYAEPYGERWFGPARAA